MQNIEQIDFCDGAEVAEERQFLYLV